MSIGLKVRFTRAIHINDLLPEIGEAICELLHLANPPLIIAEEYDGRKWLPSRLQTLSSESPVVAFGVKEEPEMAAAVSVYARQRERFAADDWADDEIGDVASIEVLGARTPLGFALVAAVAIAIARKCNTQITDDMPFYSERFDSSPDSFLAAIRVEGRFDDYMSAAEEFSSHLNRKDKI